MRGTGGRKWRGHGKGERERKRGKQMTERDRIDCNTFKKRERGQDQIERKPQGKSRKHLAVNAKHGEGPAKVFIPHGLRWQQKIRIQVAFLQTTNVHCFLKTCFENTSSRSNFSAPKSPFTAANCMALRANIKPPRIAEKERTKT
jgi:hypothetical protein